jgi:hypothetical protein
MEGIMRASATSRAVAVFGVGFSFVVMLVSGIFLIIAPKGSLANSLGWSLAGLGRDGWEAVHLATSFLFTTMALWHLVLHWSVVVNFVTGTPIHPAGHRREGGAMLLLVLLLLLTAVLNLPPASWLVELNEFFKTEYWVP